MWPTAWSDGGGQGLRGSSPQEEEPECKGGPRLGPPVTASSLPAGAAYRDEIARDHDEVTIVKLNTDENPAITGQLGITSIPTMHVYQGGELVKVLTGAQAKPKLLRELEPFLG